MAKLRGSTNHLDYAQSARWLGKAAEQGRVDAMNNQGFLYQYGWGVGFAKGIQVVSHGGGKG
jgi:TPR repeat protein